MEDYTNFNQNEEEAELSFSDKIAGIFTEPTSTFEQIAKFPPKGIDWFLPFFILLLLVIGSQWLIMSNPIIKSDAIRQQRAAQEEYLQKEVESGNLSQAQADERMEMIDRQMEQMSGNIGMIIQSISIFVMGFIIFFVVVLVYYLIVKFALKGEGTYSSALVANGLVSFIGMIQVIVTTILSLGFDRLMRDTSVASLMNIEKTELAGFLLSKVDPFSIWSYVILGIGLAKMFKSEDVKKHIIVILSVWVGWSIIVYILSKFVPFMQNF
ncbi:MAG TPA: YIP1 family protein [Ignavibacteriaceae bacterium]|mgnify:CR=1 FL=1|nr:YIP1 family protein [Ignavibacteriaceae bacterium]